MRIWHRRSVWIAVTALGACFLAPRSAVAHDPDTSYTLIDISNDAVETTFRLDLDVLRRLVVVDADGDLNVTELELRVVAPIVHDYLRQCILLSVDEGEPDLGEPQQPVWPAEWADRPVPAHEQPNVLVEFVFHREVDAMPELITLIYDFWHELGARHTNLTNFREGETHDLQVVFTRNEPDYDYYTETQPATASQQPKVPQRQHRLAPQLWRFLKLGVEHIFIGVDHILFLLALFVVSRLRDLIWIITSFTVAHTITLILAATQVVALPPRLIEVAIAATIVYVAVENLCRREFKRRWLLTFVFGLIHGFGFANVLRDLDVPTAGFVRCLLSFNVGVEVGQLGIVIVLFPLIWALNRFPFGRPTKLAMSIVIGVIGAAWLIDRTFALDMMPF